VCLYQLDAPFDIRGFLQRIGRRLDFSMFLRLYFITQFRTEQLFTQQPATAAWQRVAVAGLQRGA